MSEFQIAILYTVLAAEKSNHVTIMCHACYCTTMLVNSKGVYTLPQNTDRK